jgi:cytochrome c oxidase subunit 1
MIGMNLTFFPMHFVGMFGMPRRTWTYGPEQGFTVWNQIETVGSFIIALSTLVFAINLFTAWKRGRIAGPNPWAAATLEWSIPSPPPVYNFREIPQVHSRMPLWEGDATKAGGIPHGRVEEETEQITLGGARVAEMRDPEHDENKMSAHDLGIHLPPPSFWPLVLAMGITAIFVGLIFRQVTGPFHNLWYLMFAGVATTILAIYAWAFEPGH